MTSLSQLYFGKDDAESDATPLGLLDRSFIRTEAYEMALSGQRSLFIGRKGTGKSAICIKLNEELSTTGRACVVTPDELSGEEIRNFGLAGITPLHAMTLLWRYVFAVAVAKLVLRKRGQDKLIPDVPVFDKIRAFLVDNGEIDELTLVERLWKVVERLKLSLKVSAFHADVHMDGADRAKGLQLDAQVDIFIANVKQAAALVFSKTHPLLILVDQVEKIWTGDSNSATMVQGLLAAKDTGLGEAVRVVYFLRTDIYQAIRFPEGDKYRSDEYRLSWSGNRLVSLIEDRGNASIKLVDPGPFRGSFVRPSATDNHTPTPPRGVSSVQWWRDVWGAFPTTIDDVPIADFLLAHTLYRPRDIIQLCNACRDTALSNRHTVIAPDDVNRGLTIYSFWKLSDLAAEWGKNYPYLDDLLAAFAHSSYILTRPRLDSRLDGILHSLRERYAPWKSQLEKSVVIDTLFGIGFLGVLRRGSPLYSYEEDAQGAAGRVDPHDAGFYIHPCYRPGLQAFSALEVAPYSIDSIAAMGPVGHGFGGRLLSRDGLAIEELSKRMGRAQNAVTASGLPSNLQQEIMLGLSRAQRDLMSQQFRTSNPEVVALAARNYAKSVYEQLEKSWAAFNSGDVVLRLKELCAALDVALAR